MFIKKFASFQLKFLFLVNIPSHSITFCINGYCFVKEWNFPVDKILYTCILAACMKVINKNLYTPFRDQVYDKLRNKIIFKGWKSGTILSEGELAKLFGISRTPIREAIRRLESEGLVKVIPKKGILIPGIEKKDVEEIFELREILHCYAIKKALKNITDKDIRQLEKIIDRAGKYIKRNNNKRLVELSIQFHNFILGLASNQRFIEVDHYLRTHMIRYSSELFGPKEGKYIGWEGHRQIIDALKKKDEVLACKSMRDHFKKGKELLLGRESSIFE